MEKYIVFHPKLTKPDRMILETLAKDIKLFSKSAESKGANCENGGNDLDDRCSMYSLFTWSNIITWSNITMDFRLVSKCFGPIEAQRFE